MGKVEVGHYNYGKNTGKSKMDVRNNIHSGQSTSLQFSDKSVVDPQLFRTLRQGQAVTSLIIKGNPMDDVLNMFPIDPKKFKN